MSPTHVSNQTIIKLDPFEFMKPNTAKEVTSITTQSLNKNKNTKLEK